MILINNSNVYNLVRAVYSARNPMNSWSKSDSDLMKDILGPNDLNLAKRLCKAGSDHRKFLRQIFVSVDITAPLYWWKEYDTYKVGTTANSTSTMHKIHSKAFNLDDFSHDHMSELAIDCLNDTIYTLNCLRDYFNETKDKMQWYSMIQLLPSSYNQTRTCTMTYENLFNMINARKNHKLDEWLEFCDFMLDNCPYLEDFILQTTRGGKPWQ